MTKRSLRRAVSIFARGKAEKDEAEEPLLRYIQSRKWRKVRKFLKKSSREEISKITDISGLSPIGACFGCNAPFDISEKILLMYPEALMIGDEYGSTPLHFACMNGSHPDLIELILEQEHGRQAAHQLDNQNYGPLYLAVNYACEHIYDDKTSSGSKSSGIVSDDRIPSAWLRMNDDLYIDAIIRNSVRVIKMLSFISPEIVLQEGNDGLTPLDIIQEKKLTITNEENYELLVQIYEGLMDTAIRLYKDRKEKWEIDGYETVITPPGNDKNDQPVDSCVSFPASDKTVETCSTTRTVGTAEQPLLEN